MPSTLPWIDELPLWAYWEAMNAGNPKEEAIEFLVFLEPSVYGSEGQFGPYLAINTVTQRHFHPPMHPGIVVRVQYYSLRGSASERIVANTQTFDAEGHHGGTLLDEIAALISLQGGVRTKAGPIIRRFQPGDSTGQLSFYTSLESPTAPLRRDRLRVLPLPDGIHLHDLSQMDCLIRLGRKERKVFMRAVRLFQNALWIGDEDGSNSWLFLVSSIETLANFHYRGKRGPGWRFCEMVHSFLCAPPERRPGPYAQLDWTKEAMEQAAEKIYLRRHDALHHGKPFPSPLCEAPMPDLDSTGAQGPPCEAPLSDCWYGSSGWKRQDLPMYLHTFAYITRGVLLNWLSHQTRLAAL